MSDTEVVVPELPACDFCKVYKFEHSAHYDGRTTMGPWAYMCELHYLMYGVGLGLGKGQRLILREKQ